MNIFPLATCLAACMSPITLFLVWVKIVSSHYGKLEVKWLDDMYTWAHRLPHNAMTYLATQKTIRHITNLTEKKQYCFPGCIPGYKKGDFELLLSNTTKKVNCTIGIQIHNAIK